MTLPRRHLAMAVTAAIGVITAGAAQASVSIVPATPSASPLIHQTVQASDDAFVMESSPLRKTGGLSWLIASAGAKTSRSAYLRFVLPPVPDGSKLIGAELATDVSSSSGSKIEVHPVSSAWSEQQLDFATRPPVGAAVDSTYIAARQSTAQFNVTSILSGGHTASFALSADSGTTSFLSKEAGKGGPRLYMTYQPPTPTPTPTPTPVPSRGTSFGVSLARLSGETAMQAVTRIRGQFGNLPAARVYGTGLPPALWNADSSLAALGSGTDVIYSFRGDMAAIAAGQADEVIRSFLASRPAGIKVWVALNHEPEDNIARGEFTAAQFRAATEHVAPVIRAAGGVPTTILMQWTLSPQSGRNWHDYYSPAVDVLAFDAYNNSLGNATPSYKSPSDFVDPVLAVAKETGKAFGWAELGSPCIPSDPACLGRAAWLTGLGSAFAGNGAQFATYWNRLDFGGVMDYSLNDGPSRSAWSAFMGRR